MSYSLKESGISIEKPKKTKLEKTLIVLAAVLVAAVIGLAIGLIVVLTAPEIPPAEIPSPEKPSTEKPSTGNSTEVPPADNICYTESCLERSLFIMRAVDETIDPCEDFYQYSCGKWAANNEIPPGRSSIGTFGDIQLELDKDVNQSMYLRPVEPSKRNDNAANKAASLYKQCLKKDETPESKIIDTLKGIVSSAGGCGLLTPNWSENSRTNIDVMVSIQAYTKDTFLAIKVLPDILNTSRYRINIGGPKLQFGNNVSESNRLYLEYTKEVRAVFTALKKQMNPSLSETDFESQIIEMLEFERGLVETYTQYNSSISWPMKQRLDVFYQTFLDKLVNELVETNVPSTERLQLTVDFKFLDPYKDFLENAKIRALANYGIWTLIINELYLGLPISVRKLKQSIQSDNTGNPQAEWRTCIAATDRYFRWGATRAYIDDHEDQSLKADVTAMVDAISAEFKRTSLEQSDWIDEETKKRAINKLNLMGKVIAYPDFTTDDAKLNAYYNEITLPTTSDALFIDFLSFAARGTSVNQMNNWVERDMDRSVQVRDPEEVNAFYHPGYNSIYVYFGILYPPFYGGDLPKSMNYGGIGTVIGHEIGHGFDNTGRQYDEYGNLKNWWTNESIANFNSRAQCIVDQYSKACYPELPITPKCHDGTFTLGENIADNAGLRTTYEAYVEWKKTNKDKKLPGLTHYTDEQLLFLTHSHTWCTKMTDRSLQSRLLTDPHSQLPYRVNVNMQNLEQFSQVWNCKPGSKMNLPPAEECRVW